MENIDWIKKGNTGCVFATLFAKHPETIGWKFIDHIDFSYNQVPKDALLVSIIFPESFTKEDVRQYALANGFYEESTSDETTGLRYKCKDGVSWVQYFGLDSHVATRRAPQPMLLFTVKLNSTHYIKVGFKGVLHLAHAYSNKISEKVYNLLWQQSYKQTKRLLGHSPTIKEAAKTTWLKF